MRRQWRSSEKERKEKKDEWKEKEKCEQDRGGRGRRTPSKLPYVLVSITMYRLLSAQVFLWRPCDVFWYSLLCSAGGWDVYGNRDSLRTTPGWQDLVYSGILDGCKVLRAVGVAGTGITMPSLSLNYSIHAPFHSHGIFQCTTWIDETLPDLLEN